METKKIKVLVVDDSLVFREVISRGISSNPNIEVVGKAKDPLEAIDMVLQYRPDVMTCDIEMPKMNGIEFIKRLLPQYPIPVIIVSSISDAVFEAVNAGAVEFVSKPDVTSPKHVEKFLYELISKLKIASQAKIISARRNYLQENTNDSIKVNNERIIAIGASTGGTEALYSVLKNLPPTVPGIVVVQHIPPTFSKMFAERLNTQTSLVVKEAETGDIVEQGKVFIAPGDQHMSVKRMGNLMKIECFPGEKVNGHCPSVDVLFESVAKAMGNKAIGVILTGMGYDGAKGLLALRRSGARTFGQDESSSVVYGMPKVAYNIGAVEKQASIEKIPGLILQSLSGSR
ncbi:MAG TPA: chemotaxis response regulator protein-glutamate methylesterase [Neobacillus sp.]